MSYRRAIAAATPATLRSWRGRAGRVSHMSRSVVCTSVEFMSSSLTGARSPPIGDNPEPSLMSARPTRVTMVA